MRVHNDNSRPLHPPPIGQYLFNIRTDVILNDNFNFHIFDGDEFCIKHITRYTMCRHADDALISYSLIGYTFN